MKNKLYIYGIISVLVIVIGCLFKVSHWPGGSILLTVGLLNFIMIFLPLAMMNSYKNELAAGANYLYIIAFICIFIVCAGALFKIQNWPLSHILLEISIPIPFVIFLPTYLFQKRKDKQLNYKYLILVLFFFAYFSCLTALLAINISKSIIDETIISTYNLDNQTKIVNSQLNYTLNTCHLKDSSVSFGNKSIINIHAKSKSIDSLINRMTIGIVSNINEANKDKIDSEGNINLWEIEGKDDKSICYNEIFVNNATQLQHALSDFKKHMLSLVSPNDIAVMEYINRSLDINENWQELTFDKQRMISIIESLYCIKNNVALVRYETIQTLLND